MSHPIGTKRISYCYRYRIAVVQSIRSRIGMVAGSSILGVRHEVEAALNTVFTAANGPSFCSVLCASRKSASESIYVLQINEAHKKISNNDLSGSFEIDGVDYVYQCEILL